MKEEMVCRSTVLVLLVCWPRASVTHPVSNRCRSIFLNPFTRSPFSAPATNEQIGCQSTYALQACGNEELLGSMSKRIAVLMKTAEEEHSYTRHLWSGYTYYKHYLSWLPVPVGPLATGQHAPGHHKILYPPQWSPQYCMRVFYLSKPRFDIRRRSQRGPAGDSAYRL